jgi:hypothetical protein
MHAKLHLPARYRDSGRRLSARQELLLFRVSFARRHAEASDGAEIDSSFLPLAGRVSAHEEAVQCQDDEVGEVQQRFSVAPAQE